MAFRRADLDRIGGFKSIVDYLADDYELGRRIAALGRQVVLSDVVVETHLPAYDLRGFLSHQLRWARGVRDSRAGGYVGLVSTYGLMWGLLAVLSAPAAPWSWAALGVTMLSAHRGRADSRQVGTARCKRSEESVAASAARPGRSRDLGRKLRRKHGDLAR